LNACARRPTATIETGRGAAYYERHGERRMAEGTYAQVIRYGEHLRPLRDALRLHARTSRR
jgi:hypothetical protein